MPALPLWPPVLVAVLLIMLANANPLLKNLSPSFLFLAWPLLVPALLSLPLSQVPVLYVLVPTLLRQVVLVPVVQGVVLEEAAEEEEEEVVIRDQQRLAVQIMAATVAIVLLVLLRPLVVVTAAATGEATEAVTEAAMVVPVVVMVAQAAQRAPTAPVAPGARGVTEAQEVMVALVSLSPRLAAPLIASPSKPSWNPAPVVASNPPSPKSVALSMTFAVNATRRARRL